MREPIQRCQMQQLAECFMSSNHLTLGPEVECLAHSLLGLVTNCDQLWPAHRRAKIDGAVVTFDLGGG